MSLATLINANTLAFYAPRQLSDQNSQGTILGASATDLVGFYGDPSPVVQPSAAGQAAIPNTGVSTGAGALTHYTSTQSPGTAVTTLTTSEQSITVTGVLATDLVVINKPSSQVGLPMCTGRVSAANTVRLVFANTTTGSLTPTASEAYIITTVPADLQLSATLTPAAVPASLTVEQSFTVIGVDVGMTLAVNKPSTQVGLAVMAARVIAKNTVGITYLNVTSSPITPTASEVYIFAALNGLVASSQVIEFGVNVGTLTSVATITTAQQTVTVAGIQATDVAVGVQKPSQQAGLGLTGAQVTAANTVGFNFVNPTAAGITPTASEVYALTIFRPSPVAPMNILMPTIAPASVAANTSAEQTFTVTGLVSGQPVNVDPPVLASNSPGLSIAQTRVSAANTLAITYVNTTATAMTPSSGVYTVSQFNMVTPTAGDYVQTLVSPLTTLGVSLMNQLRSALVALNLIAGS